MAERSFPFDSVASDRILDTDKWSQLTNALVINGVVPGVDSEMRITPTAPESLGVLVRLGHFFIEGRHYHVFSEPVELELATADPVNSRIDRIVVRRNLAEREVTAAVITGEPAAAPELPALTQNTLGIWEEELARIQVPANATSISASAILDFRTFAASPMGFGGWEPAVVPGVHRGHEQRSVAAGPYGNFSIAVPEGKYSRIRLTMRGRLMSATERVRIRINNDSTSGLHRVTNHYDINGNGAITSLFSGDFQNWSLATWSTLTAATLRCELFWTNGASFMAHETTGSTPGSSNNTRIISHSSGRLNANRLLSSIFVMPTVEFQRIRWWLEGYRDFFDVPDEED